MQRAYRCRYPVCLTSLLADISVKGAELDPDETRGSSSSSARVCGLCIENPARYTCPRCNIPYCALSCYKGSAHTACSEQFYSECVREELRARGETEQRSILEILLRLREQDGVVQELMEEVGGDAEGMDPEALKLLSRLAQEEGLEEEGEEIQHVLRLNHSDDDLETKLSGLNIDALNEDELWALLPKKEKHRFEELLKGGAIGAMIPVWRPWWEEHKQEAESLVQEIQEEEESSEGGHGEITADGGRSSDVPPIDAKIPSLDSLCSSPSLSVRFSLLNALYAYTFSLHMFNGDLSEPQQMHDFVAVVLSVSASLGSGRTFHTFSESLAAARDAAAWHSHAHCPDATLQAVAHVLGGRSQSDPAGYTLSALSQLRSAFSGVRKAMPTQQDRLRRACFLAGKKCQFLQAWANENTAILRGLAREAWRESGRMRKEQEQMDREKKAVEKERSSRTRESRREKVLIQEI